MTRRTTLDKRRTQFRPEVRALEDRVVPAGFSFPDFSTTTGLTLLGAAATSGTRLRLTPAVGGQSGAAWYTAEKQFAGLAFETTFDFQLTGDGPAAQSDGFVFVIQNTAPTYLSGGGGTLGYYVLQNSLAIEFDTFQNSEASDPSQSHLSVHTNGLGPNGWSESLSLGSYDTSPASLDDGATHAVKITYTPGTLAIYLDNMTTPKLSVAVDLAEKLGLDAGKAWVGFTAATGGGVQNHDILNWAYTVIPDVTTTVWANDASVIEGDAGTASLVFTVTRDGSTTGTTIVNWTTENRTATAGSDYVATYGQVTFDPTDTQKQVTITVNGDTAIEASETLALRLTTATGGSIADGIGLGTILTDDVSISISDAEAIEGDTEFKALGAFVAPGIGGLFSAYAMTMGPDGNLYVSGNSASAVYRYTATGSPLPAAGKPGAEFVSPGAGGLNQARDVAFGPDGYLYVVSQGTDEVLRYDPTTGAAAGVLVAAGSGGLDAPRGLLFQGGYVYVTSVGTETASTGKDSVLRYDATTGAPAGVSALPGDAVFIASGSGGLDNPSRMVFGPDGKAYVSSTASVGTSTTTNSILRYNGTTGAFDTVFVSPGSGGLDGPVAMVFRPDGYLYLTSWRNNAVYRYDATTGAFGGTIVAPGSSGLSTAIDLLFEPSGNVLVTSLNTHEIVRFGPYSQAAFTVSLSSPSAIAVTVNFTTAPNTATADVDYTTTSGTISFAPGEATKTVLVQTLSDLVLESDETFFVNLSSPSIGATIADGQGVGTIFDPGQEVTVNTTTGGVQRTNQLPFYYNGIESHQAVASDGAGNYVIVWSGNGVGDADGIFFQRYDASGTALGGETLVNVTTAGAQSNPAVGRASSNGKYVIAWNSADGVYGRVYNFNGTAATGQITIAAGSSGVTTVRNYVQAIGMDADGDFVVLYKQWVDKAFSDTYYWYAQRYNAAGTAQGGAIRVTTLSQTNGLGGIASDANGNFVVVWSDGPINAQRYNNSGKKVGSLINVNSGVPGTGSMSNVGRDADGDFVVTWVVQSGAIAKHYLQVLNNDGTKRGSAVNFRDAWLPIQAGIAVEADGDFVVTFTDSPSQPSSDPYAPHPSSDVYVQRFNLNGAAIGAAKRVNQKTAGYQEHSSVAVASNGNHVVVWNTPVYNVHGEVTESDVRAHRYDLAAPLKAAGGAGVRRGGALKAGPELEAIFAEAMRRWTAAGVDTSVLGRTQLRVGNLGGRTLGFAAGNTITVDDNAAGHGWFVDKTPWEDGEFTRKGNQGEQGRMDLLTVVMHEMGHVLGRGHEASGLLAESLAPGTRWLPNANAIDQLIGNWAIGATGKRRNQVAL